MTRQSEQLEREVEQSRADLASSLDALRNRLTPGQIVEEAVDYARETPVAEFARNVSRDVQANPMPLIIIFTGIAWACIATALSSKRKIPAVEKANAAPPPVERSRQPDLLVSRPEWEVSPIREPVE
jgi:hypothetical protein